MKQGNFDDKNAVVRVLSGAHPDVLLQPQYFTKAPFVSMEFVSTTSDGNNTIAIAPDTESHAYVTFECGENSLAGIPKEYKFYSAYFLPKAKPTAANIDTILLNKINNIFTIQTRREK